MSTEIEYYKYLHSKTREAAIFNNIRAIAHQEARLRSAISNILFLSSRAMIAWPHGSPEEKTQFTELSNKESQQLPTVQFGNFKKIIRNQVRTSGNNLLYLAQI